ncbi:MAG: hypothetical protein KKG99_09840 [Bacteroidetes bacterium]|nr:hypothetical protein [Bacteroidota bacterium]
MKDIHRKNVLLIGKYPPMQGGIAAKTFWLYKRLAKNGYNFRVVTIEIENYSVPVIKDDIKVFSVDKASTPWHIPDSSLYFDRILNKCFEALANFTPDIIETNYLWPFCSVAIHLSKILNKPLLIRHAGSDILKFYTSNEFRDIIKRYFEQASIIVTNNTSIEIVSELCNDKTKIRLTDRYIPDPDYFHDLKHPKQYDILFAGKINYYWKHKGISYLLEYIKAYNLHALLLCDGNYIDEIYSLVDKQKLENNIEIKKFVHPYEMPAIINKSNTVWCWDEEGSIDDFSNIIWEACYCNVECLINEKIEKTTDLKKMKELFSENLLEFKKVESMSYFNNEISFSNSINLEAIIKEFKLYIDQNVSIYNNI